MAKKSLIKTIILIVIVGFFGFYVGIQYQMTQQKNLPTGGAQMPSNGANQQGQTGKQGNSMGAGPVSGEITALDETTVTIKTQDGSSKIVIYSTSTKVNKTSEGSKSDLKVGEKVTAIGSTSTDGTVTAQSISIGNGTLQGMPAGGQPGQNGGQPPSANTQ
jgi:hypothetical protein